MGTIEVDLNDVATAPGIAIEINNGDFPDNPHQNGNAVNSTVNPSESIDPNYWKWTICAVSLPFTVLGLPTHLIFGKHRVNGSPLLSFTHPSLLWLRSVFDPAGQKPLVLILTLFTSLVTAGFSLFVLISFFSVFYHLVILGQIPEILLINTLNIFRVGPAVVPVLYCWYRGYYVKRLINSFDTLQRDLRETLYLTFDPKTALNFSNGAFSPGRNVRRTLIGIYGTIFITQMIHMLAQSTGSKTMAGVNYWIDVMYCFVLPLYCTFCWAISSEYEFLAAHLQNFRSKDSQPNFHLFTSVKVCFKKVITHVYRVNQLFRALMSWVILVMLISILVKFFYASLYLFGYATLRNIIYTSLGVEDHNGTGNGNTNGNGGTGSHIQRPDPTPDPEELTLVPEMVRAATGFLFVAFVQLYLLSYTIWQAVKVNDQARYLHVLLNDYSSQVADQMTPEVYHAYRLLKYFMHSTMEQEDSALLRLPVLSCFACMPQMRNRLQGYHLRS